MTISGAALDANMNSVSTPLTALMTLFNTRLGWWMENPDASRRHWGLRKRPWQAEEPGFGWPLVLELLGLTNEKKAWIHLSDGGHFENLGVYELIRRRCRFIIAVDGGEDPRAASDNMACMLRLVRTDFGIRIDLDPTLLQTVGKDKFSPWHCVLGRIRYDEVDAQAVAGVLIYLQATLTGDEPPDVLEYAARHPSFPHQSTVDQFFDEAQFESYRALGHHAALQVFSEAAPLWTGEVQNVTQHQAEVQALFTYLRRQWLTPPASTEADRLAAAKVALQAGQSIGGQAALVPFTLALYPELSSAPLPTDVDNSVPEFRAVSQTLQVMEIAWSTLKLNQFHAHPSNRGWMSTFRRWTTSPAFQQYWPFLRGEYGAPFVSFCENRLNLQRAPVEWERLNVPPQPEFMDCCANLNDQFRQEWGDYQAELPQSSALADPQLITNVVNDAWIGSGAPFAWLLHANSVPNAPVRQHCFGLACVTSLPLLNPTRVAQEAEFLLWLSGPYRSLGTGTAALSDILQVIESECSSGLLASSLRTLTVFYPLQPNGVSDGKELERWMSFFFDHGFRRQRQPDRGPGSQFAVLKRALY
jgi:hypothetical protein